MRRVWLTAVVLGLATAGFFGGRLAWFRAPRAATEPLPVPAGDREVAWLHTPTSFEVWQNFVWGVKRAEVRRDGSPGGLEVDDSAAFPEKTTAVPEVVVRRRGYSGALRVRWYKVTDEVPQEAWVAALAARDPAPVAVFGGWSSDRAKELASAMREAGWPAARPALFLATATADDVAREADTYPADYTPPQLIGLYDRSFRLCFTNRQMAGAVTDFVFSDPTLRPGPVVWPGLRAVPAAAGGGWAAAAALADLAAEPPPLPAFTIAWDDDDFSVDLRQQFITEIANRSGAAGRPRLDVIRDNVPFSTGRLNRPNPREAAVAEEILKQLPPPGHRTVLVLPAVSAPVRRTLRALVQGDPGVGRRLVVLNGDGIGVNTLFRDREFLWPVRSLPVPVAIFTHADPFAWDRPGEGPAPPPGYELPPPDPGGVRSTTEEIQLYARAARVIAAAAFPDGSAAVVAGPDELAHNLRHLTPAFFDAAGNRLSGTGEHVVVLRPVFPGEGPNGRGDAEARLEVYTRRPGDPAWVRLHDLPLARTNGGHGE
jgi:hypothetical protein